MERTRSRRWRDTSPRPRSAATRRQRLRRLSLTTSMARWMLSCARGRRTLNRRRGGDKDGIEESSENTSTTTEEAPALTRRVREGARDIRADGSTMGEGRVPPVARGATTHRGAIRNRSRTIIPDLLPGLPGGLGGCITSGPSFFFLTRFSQRGIEEPSNAKERGMEFRTIEQPNAVGYVKASVFAEPLSPRSLFL